MVSKTTRDLLDQVRDFHKRLSDFYANRADIAKDQRAKMLLEYMSRHELNLEQCLEEYEDVGANEVLDTWFKFAPDIAEPECLDGVELKDDMTVHDIIMTAILFDNCLIEFFKEMAEKAVSEHLREFFDSLVQLENSEKLKMMRSALQIDQI